MLGCVIMAAGNAVRFGANKLEAELDGKPLIRRAFEAVPAGVFDRVVVVTQYPAVAALAREFGFTPVRNDRPGDGLSRTVRLGTQALAQCDGIAFLVETATDNTNRTVANVRMYFNKCGGTLGNSGSVAFMFDHKCVFKFHAAEGADMEELELEMIDLGVDEFYPEEDGVTVYAPYESFGAIQKWLDDKGYEIVSGESVYLPTDTKELDAEGRESIEKLVEKLEEDDDVTNVYHNMKEVDEE